LATDTQLDIVELSPQTMQIELAQGRIGLHTRGFERNEMVEIDTPRGGIWLLSAGVYDFDAGNGGSPTRVAVFEGSARFIGGGIDITVDAGEVLVLRKLRRRWSPCRCRSSKKPRSA
jgi:FecR protein